MSKTVIFLDFAPKGFAVETLKSNLPDYASFWKWSGGISFISFLFFLNNLLHNSNI